MMIKLNDSLLEHMKQKEKKNLILEVIFSHVWGATKRVASARIVGEDEMQFIENGYESQDTVIGKVFIRPEEFTFGPEPEIRLLDFWGVPGIRTKDIDAV